MDTTRNPHAEDDGVDYTTPGDPIESEQSAAERGDLDATPGNPLTGADDDESADFTTPGNPITSAEHREEESHPHATPGNPLEDTP